MPGRETIRIDITGVIQGVGFRPFVYACAKKHGIRGYVANTPKGVEIVASGERESILAFQLTIRSNPPANSVISTFESATIEPGVDYIDFTIRTSSETGEKSARISPDLPICEACVSELLDPGNRRYYYPYTNCAHCGPRYTIVKDIPYDRKFTTMSSFVMCGKCAGEYADPEDRRFHAQPNACFACGPAMELCDGSGKVIETSVDAKSSTSLFSRLRKLLEGGSVIAVKGIGGFHLACDATNSAAVGNLRSRKLREAKPFAVMARDARSAREYAHISEHEEALLASAPRPIVLLEKKSGSRIVSEVSPRTSLIGLMLPYTPLHFLLFDGFSLPIVMTSANSSDEPIAYDNDDAKARLSSIADYFLFGNREIHTRCDDSVTRSVSGREYVTRRSRGYVPNPFNLRKPIRMPVIALGAEQKNTVCIGSGNRAILSHHIGDLDNPKAFASFKESIQHLCTLFDIAPERVAYDLHPEYLNTKYLLSGKLEGTLLSVIPAIGVQHHHAHIASCMAENGASGDVIGIALDGTGWGSDGTVWGGELLLVKDSDFTRVGSLSPVRMPGGAVAIRKPWRMALAYLRETFGEEYARFIPRAWRAHVSDEELKVADFQLSTERESPVTTSCGRLFDGVAALLSVCTDALYEGEPAIELEQKLDDSVGSGYSFPLEERGDFLYISWKPAVRDIIEDMKSEDVSFISSRFHNGIADAFKDACIRVSKTTGVERAALSGGCFMNVRLLLRLEEGLRRAGLTVFTHSTVPCNDGGISLGQLIVAANAAE